MLDAPARRVLAPPLDAAAGLLERAHVRPLGVTLVGWLVGVAACVAAGTGHWWWALALWLGNRLLDGLDGPLARRTGATELGGFLDLVADFSIYAGFVVAVGVAVPEARIACLALLLAYYLSGTAFLLLSPMLERRGAAGDGRSVLFVGGLAEGTETVLAYVAFCLLPEHAATIAWLFAGLVGLTAAQRVGLGIRVLGRPRTTPAHDHDQERSP
ncbi:CDP-alcohol phosphatidyltransferase family protein [Nocardioides donggukensis]|uniref:CDP-alcohol phosphatidyltransferase family protein n=1 Tax=Nocardioides donggukensis TaxID=2774019 RepID=A0A927PZY9_9ACTN|nr:CDP-alcohol phosphatidyltransferase family protein [Nocardioides donggukensis]MBD8868247.1 CDP-alcohol phosphatidyltransferase family protein [Nocardioides donggukensis]